MPTTLATRFYSAWISPQASPSSCLWRWPQPLIAGAPCSGNIHLGWEPARCPRTSSPLVHTGHGVWAAPRPLPTLAALPRCSAAFTGTQGGDGAARSESPEPEHCCDGAPHTEVCPLTLWRLGSEIKVLPSRFLPAAKEASVLGPPSTIWGVAGRLWLSSACRCITSIFCLHVIFPLCAPVSVPKFSPFHKDTPHVRLGAPLLTSF